MIYLACPYSHKERSVRVERFENVSFAASVLMYLGLKVFSPISHCHPMAEAGGLPTDWKFWKEYNEYMIGVCTGFAVLTLDGWRESVGVTAETAIAREQGKVSAAISWEAIQLWKKE